VGFATIPILKLPVSPERDRRRAITFYGHTSFRDNATHEKTASQILTLVANETPEISIAGGKKLNFVITFQRICLYRERNEIDGFGANGVVRWLYLYACQICACPAGCGDKRHEQQNQPAKH
jgi:hypothetical protein